VHPKEAPVGEQVVQLVLGQAAVFQTSNSSLTCSQTRLTVDLEIVASGPRASARDASTSRTDRPRTNPAMTSDSSAFVLVTPMPSRRDANASALPRTFGRCRVTSPAVDLIDTEL